MFFIACMTKIQLHFAGTKGPARHCSLFILAVHVSCMWLENVVSLTILVSLPSGGLLEWYSGRYALSVSTGIPLSQFKLKDQFVMVHMCSILPCIMSCIYTLAAACVFGVCNDICLHYIYNAPLQASCPTTTCVTQMLQRPFPLVRS